MTKEEFLATSWEPRKSKVRLGNGRVYKLHKIVFRKNKLPLLVLACKKYHTLFVADNNIIKEHVTDKSVKSY